MSQSLKKKKHQYLSTRGEASSFVFHTLMEQKQGHLNIDHSGHQPHICEQSENAPRLTKMQCSKCITFVPELLQVLKIGVDQF